MDEVENLSSDASFTEDVNRFSLLEPEFLESESDKDDQNFLEPKLISDLPCPKRNKNRCKKGRKGLRKQEKPSPSQTCSADLKPDLGKLLFVHHNDLDPNNEFKKLLGKTFGSRLVGVAKSNLRSGIFKIKEGWPSSNHIGMNMSLIRTDSQGVSWYKFNHTENYKTQQQLFWLFQRQMDHESIIADVLTKNPFHLDSLLLISEFLRLQEDFEQSNDCIERGLFACEVSFHPTFRLVSHCHQLEYTWRENRAFFIFLHKYLKNLINRRCFQTALNFAKIIFMKNQLSDPLSMLLIIDSLCLKAKNYIFLLDFYKYFVDLKRLDLLPNFLYSCALASYHLSVDKPDDSKQYGEQAHEFLEMAIIRFPFVIAQLLKGLQIKPDKSFERNPFLSYSAIYRESSGLKLLTDIYVHHTLEVWRNHDILGWLESEVNNIASAKKDELEIWIQRRKVFVGIPRSITRHCLLNEISINDQNNVDSSITDPCPPINSTSGYEAANLEEIFGITEEVETGMNEHNVLANFIMTLIPLNIQVGKVFYLNVTFVLKNSVDRLKTLTRRWLGTNDHADS